MCRQQRQPHRLGIFRHLHEVWVALRGEVPQGSRLVIALLLEQVGSAAQFFQGRWHVSGTSTGRTSRTAGASATGTGVGVVGVLFAVEETGLCGVQQHHARGLGSPK